MATCYDHQIFCDCWGISSGMGKLKVNEVNPRAVSNPEAHQQAVVMVCNLNSIII